MSEAAPTVEGIDTAGVTDWLEAEIEGARPPFEFELIPAGHSNMTFRVSDSASHLYVLRRPPLGAVLKTAHDMGREHRIIAALAPTEVPVPRALGMCEDEEVNGAPFYVMAFVAGHVLVNAAHSEEHTDVAQRGQIS
ncbi:uncharacterized protein METZ01_LOCUS493868, partial [marine metagenome]